MDPYPDDEYDEKDDTNTAPYIHVELKSKSDSDLESIGVRRHMPSTSRKKVN
jgi:hypothetical protein